MLKIFRFSSILFISFGFLNSCTDQGDFCSQEGTISDLLGIDACTLVILGDNGDIYVPENILEFGLAFYDGQRVNFSHRLSTQNLPCFRGVPVELLCIQPL